MLLGSRGFSMLPWRNAHEPLEHTTEVERICIANVLAISLMGSSDEASSCAAVLMRMLVIYRVGAQPAIALKTRVNQHRLMCTYLAYCSMSISSL